MKGIAVDAIIVDMDGTLCDVSGIRHYVEGERKNFHAFHEASRFCPTKPIVEGCVRGADALGIAVLIVTARDAKFERPTRDFLVRHEIPWHAIYMRGWDDTRKDAVVKDEIFHRIIADGWNPIAAIDDREDIAQVWRSHGIPTHVVE